MYYSVHAKPITNTFGYYLEPYTFDRGVDNKVSGFISFADGFVVPDYGTVTLDTAGILSGAIDQNPHMNGEIILHADLNLDSGALLSPGARINGQGNSVIMQGDFTIPANGTLRIIGDTKINGKNNTLKLGSQARIIVDNSVTLSLYNMRIKNTHNDLSNPIITSNGSQARIALQNVELALEDEFVFADGQLFVHDDVIVSGQNAVFTYRSNQVSHIANGSLLTIDKGSKFLYYPTIFDRDLITLQSETAGIRLDHATFEAMQTPLRLMHGTLSFDNKVTISSQVSSGLISQYGQEPYNILLERTQQEVNTFAAMVDSDMLSADIGAHVNAVAWTSDGKYLAVGLDKAADKEIRIYEFDGVSLTDLDLLSTDTRATVYSVAWSSDDKYLAVGLESGGHEELQIYEFNKSAPSLTPKDQVDFGVDVYSVAWKSNNLLAVALQTGAGKEVRVYSFDGSSLSEYTGLPEIVGATAYSVAWQTYYYGIYTFLVVGYAEAARKEVRVYEFDGGELTDQEILPADIGANAFSVAWRASSLTLAVALGSDAYRELRVYTPILSGSSISGIKTTGVEIGANAYSVAWSANGNYVAVGLDAGANQELQVYSFDGSSLTNRGAIDTDIGTQINAVDWSPDGNYVAVGLESGATKELRVYTWTDRAASVKTSAWSSDGKYLAVGLEQGALNEVQEIRVFEFDGQSLTDLGALPVEIGARVNSVAWTSDDQYLAVGFEDAATKEIRVYSFNVTSRGATLTDLDALDSDIGASVNAVSWSPDDKYLAVGLDSTADKEVRMYEFDGSSLNYVGQISADVGGSAHSVDWSSDGKYLAAGFDGSADKEIRVYSGGESLDEIDALPSDLGVRVHSVAWRPDGNYVAVGKDNDVRVYSFDGSSLTLSGYASLFLTYTNWPSTYSAYYDAYSVAWSSDGAYLAVGATFLAWMAPHSCYIRVYSFNGSSLSLKDSIYYSSSYYVNSVDWSPDDQHLAVGLSSGATKEIRVYSFVSENLSDLGALPADLGVTSNSVAWSPDGNYLAVGLSQNNSGIRIYQFSSGSLTQVYQTTDASSVPFVAWSPDGNYLAAGLWQTNSAVRVYQFSAGTLSELDRTTDATNVSSVAWNPDGSAFVAGFNQTTDNIRVYGFDGSSLSEADRITSGSYVYSVDWSPDGSYIVAGLYLSAYKEVRIYAFSGLGLTDLDALPADLGPSVQSVAWSSDTKYLAVGLDSSADQEVRVYSFSTTDSTLTNLNVLSEDIGATAWSVAWDPTDKYLAVGLDSGAHKEVRVYWFNGDSLFDLGALPVDIGASAYSVVWTPDGKHISVGLAGGTEHKEIHVYELLQTSASWDQYAMIFGNSSQANSDLNVKVLGRAHIDLYGRIHDDSST